MKGKEKDGVSENNLLTKFNMLRSNLGRTNRINADTSSNAYSSSRLDQEGTITDPDSAEPPLLAIYQNANLMLSQISDDNLETAPTHLQQAEQEYIKLLRLAYTEATGNEEYRAIGFKGLGDCYVKKARIVALTGKSLIHISKLILDAIALYNYSLALYQSHKKNINSDISGEALDEILKVAVKKAEQQFLIDIAKKPQAVLSDYKLDQTHQTYLQGIRNEASARLKQQQALRDIVTLLLPPNTSQSIHEKKTQLILEENGLSIQQIYQKISTQIRHFVMLLIEECKEVLGRPPCDYAIICFGSLARDEATPYSDLEFGILIEDMVEIFEQLGTTSYEINGKNYSYEEAGKLLNEKHKEYFRNLTKLLNIKVINLGETTPRMQHIEILSKINLLNRYSVSPVKHGFAFDGQRQGDCKTPLGNIYHDLLPEEIYELICTSKEMLLLHSEERHKNDRHLSTVLSTTKLIDGNHSLLSKYRREFNAFLDTSIQATDSERVYRLREQRALSLLEENVNKFEPKMGIYQKQKHFFSAKYDLYRLPNMVFDQLAMYTGIKVRSIWKKIAVLEKEYYFGHDDTSDLKTAINQINEIRLRAYLAYDGQDNRIFPLDEMKLEVGFKLADAFSIDMQQLINIYRSLIPLYWNASNFVYGKGNKPFVNLITVSMDKDFIEAEISKRLFDYQKAIELYKKLIEKYREDKLALAMCFSKLGSIYYYLGLHDEQLKYCKKAYKNIKGKDGEEVGAAKCLGNLANAYYNAFDYVNALETIEKCSQTLKIICGAASSDYAISLHNLGNIYMSLGRMSEAQTAYEDAYANYQNQDTKDLNIIETILQLCNLQQMRGHYTEAEANLNRAINIVEEVYGDEHPIMIALCEKLAAFYIVKCQYGFANANFKKAHFIYKQIYGESENRHKASLLDNEGHMLSELCLYEEALEKHSDAWRIMSMEFGHESPAIVFSLSHLASVYLSLEKYEEAEKIFKQSLEIYQKKGIKKHHNLAKIHQFMGQVYFDKGESKDAITQYNLAISIFGEIYDKNFVNHPDKANTLLLLGNACRQMKKKLYNAKRRYRDALSIYETIYGKDAKHPDIANCYTNLGSIHEELNECKEAIINYDDALKIYRAVYGNDHYQVAVVLNNLGVVYNRIGENYEREQNTFAKAAYTKASSNFTDSYNILKKLYIKHNPNHSKLAEVSCHLADTQFFLARVKYFYNRRKISIEVNDHINQAKCYWRKARNIFEKIESNKKRKFLDNIAANLSTCDKIFFTSLQSKSAITNSK